MWKRSKSGQINARTLLQVKKGGEWLTQNISSLSQIKKHQKIFFRTLQLENKTRENQNNCKIQ